MSNPRKAMKPIILSHDRKMFQPQKPSNVRFPEIKFPVHVYKEEVIYESKKCDFLKGDSQEVSIVNRLNLVNKTCRTIAKCTSRGVSVETTSDEVCSLIGQKNYDTVLSALSSIFNEETKVRGILSLLKPPTKHTTQTSRADLVEASTQTDESMLSHFIQDRQQKRKRKSQITTYAVKESPHLKKCVINIDGIIKKELKDEVKDAEDTLPHLNIDEECSLSVVSMSSVPSLPGALDQAAELLDTVENATVKERVVNTTFIKVLDGSTVMIPMKPEDQFHIATPEILKHVTKDERRKLLQYQAYIDLKMCLEQDEDGYYPLHAAVLSDEAVLVRRQCVALRVRGESVDILAGGMTALHMAISQDSSPACIRALLCFGADPLLCDVDGRTGFHLGADAAIRTLQCVLHHCDTHARRVLQNNGEFWRPELESKTDLELKQYLYDKVAEMFDEQGYTPLMVAAGAGRARHAAALAARAPARLDAAARCGGDTALYRAAAAACLRARDSDNHSLVPENYLKTVEVLVESGADPTVENNSGSSVNTLLTEFNISALSMTIANKMNALTHRKLSSNVMLYKDADGRIGLKNINGKDVDPAIVAGKFVKDIPAMDAVNPPKRGDSEQNRKEVKRFTIVAPKEVKGKSADAKKVAVKIIKPTKRLVLKDNLKIEPADKVIIIENVKLDKALPKIVAAGSAAVNKPRNIVIRGSLARMAQPKHALVKIAEKPTNNEGVHCKKRKMNDVIK